MGIKIPPFKPKPWPEDPPDSCPAAVAQLEYDFGPSAVYMEQCIGSTGEWRCDEIWGHGPWVIYIGCIECQYAWYGFQYSTAQCYEHDGLWDLYGQCFYQFLGCTENPY
jgi:hypothetical protein